MQNFKQFINEASDPGIKHSDILKALSSIERKIVDTPLTPQRLAKLFEKPLNSIVPCTVSRDTSPAVSHNTVNITAFFDQDVDEEDWEWEEYQFEFIFVFNPDDKEITLSSKFWNWFKAELADAVIHEMLHRGQARSRSYDVDGTQYFGVTKDQQYYGRPDEVEAFALNAALELKRNHKTTARAIKALQSFTRIDRSAPSLKRYMETFQSPDHPVMRVFVKKVYQFLKTDM